MAVADPDINELTLMSYDSRPRACKDIYKIPRKGDYIEVLWCLDNLPGMPNRWCPAEVLHVSNSTDQDCIAKGVIRYLPGDTWDQQFHFVDFLDKYTLRCSAGMEEGEVPLCPDPNEENDTNPTLEWRFGTDGEVQSDSDSDDGNWCSATVEEGGHGTHRALNRAQNEGGKGNMNQVEIKALRNGHASLAVEVEKLSAELVKVSRHLVNLRNTNEEQTRCASAACVLPRIRQKLALKMQAGLRQVPLPTRKRKRDDPDQDVSLRYVDGMHPGIIRARVECTLQQFESVSRHVRANSTSGSIFFFPEFSYTQLPLQCSLEFRILFKTFMHLCHIIGVDSASDMKEMARKCGKGPKGEVLRLLGTYCYDEDDERRSAHFFPGSSCGDASPQIFEQSTTNTDSSVAATEVADPLFPILSRRTREWDRVDCRYRHKLRKESVSLPALTEMSPDMKAFSITWKRAAELGGRAWSQALCESGEVFGWLEICLPFVQTVGKQRCQELGGIGNDDMWDDLLRRRSQ